MLTIKSRSDLYFSIFVILISIIYYIGISYIPFHPDESTQIFMSSDFTNWFSNPGQLFWDSEKTNEIKQTYRLLDAPISRLLIGLGRTLTQAPPLEKDWDWGADWNSNQRNGALPGQNLLNISRFSVAVLFPFSLWLIYSIAKKISGGSVAGWAAAILLIGNPQIALHTRRAMAESALLFSTLLCLYFFLNPPRRIWLLAIPVALAFNSKQTAVGLFLFGLIYVIFQSKNSSMRKRLIPISLYLLLFLLVFLLLNPVYWEQPFHSLGAALHTRGELVTAQTDTFRQLNPNLVLDSSWKKVLSFFTQVFFSTPQFAETGNYTQDLASSIKHYYANFGNRLFSQPTIQVLTVILSIAGMIGIFTRARRKPPGYEHLYTFITIFFIVVLSLVFFIPLSFQRYYLPSIPFLCLFSADMINAIVVHARKKKVD